MHYPVNVFTGKVREYEALKQEIAQLKKDLVDADPAFCKRSR